MIRYIRINLACVVILSATVNLMFASPTFLAMDQPHVRVALLGVQFGGLESKSQEKILNDFLTMLQLEPALMVQTPSDVEKVLGSERVTHLLRDLPRDSLLYLSSILDVDYVFAAKIANESKDSGQIILVGSFNRYDRLTGASYSYSILKFYQNFHEDLKIIKEQFVTTILPKTESILSKWPFFVVAGLAFVGIILLLFSVTKSGEEGDRPPEPTPT